MISNHQTVKGLQCIFPFKYNDELHYECYVDEDSGKLPFCATKVDSELNIVESDFCQPDLRK